MTKAPRPYVSPARTAAAGETRQRVIDAAGALLAGETSLAGISLEAVAKAAGVTRLTVYNQFGSRRGLLEAVFDERARLGGLGRIPSAMALADPSQGLSRLIEIFCDFWSGDASVGRLYDSAALDQEFAVALAERNERRRNAIRNLIGRIPVIVETRTAQREDVVDLIFGLTSYPMFQTLSGGRSSKAAAAIVASACMVALESLIPAESAAGRTRT